MSTEISLINQYPKDKYTLLVPIETIAKISEIQKPVINAVTISTKLEDKEIYVQEKAGDGYKDRNGRWHPPTPELYALSKRALTKLAKAAGIKQVESAPVLPSTCQKCAEVNRMTGKIIPCGQCPNKDVKYRVTISVPQLTGESLYFVDHHEINVETVTATMSNKQKTEFMKHLAQICEAKALNGAIRTALQIKGTYTLEELQKPFVVAYLVPNLDNPDVKRVAIENMFNSTKSLFGVQQKVIEAPQEIKTAKATYEDVEYDESVIESYVDDIPVGNTSTVQQKNESYPPATSYQSESPAQQAPAYQCMNCGATIDQRVHEYSMNKFGRPLCRNCQRGARR